MSNEVVIRVVVEQAGAAPTGWRPKGGKCKVTPMPMYGLGKKLWFCPKTRDDTRWDCTFEVVAIQIAADGVTYLDAKDRAWAERDVEPNMDASCKRWPTKFVRGLPPRMKEEEGSV